MISLSDICNSLLMKILDKVPSQSFPKKYNFVNWYRIDDE